MQACLAPWLACSWLLSIIATYTLRYNYTFELAQCIDLQLALLVLNTEVTGGIIL